MIPMPSFQKINKYVKGLQAAMHAVKEYLKANPDVPPDLANELKQGVDYAEAVEIELLDLNERMRRMARFAYNMYQQREKALGQRDEAFWDGWKAALAEYGITTPDDEVPF